MRWAESALGRVKKAKKRFFKDILSTEMQQNRLGVNLWWKMELVLFYGKKVSDLYTPAADTYLLFCHLPCATTTSVCCSTCISADL